jgi:hypothetical protein
MKRQVMWDAGGFASTRHGTVSGLPSTSVYSFWARLALGTSVCCVRWWLLSFCSSCVRRSDWIWWWWRARKGFSERRGRAVCMALVRFMVAFRGDLLAGAKAGPSRRAHLVGGAGRQRGALGGGGAQANGPLSRPVGHRAAAAARLRANVVQISARSANSNQLVSLQLFIWPARTINKHKRAAKSRPNRNGQIRPSRPIECRPLCPTCIRAVVTQSRKHAISCCRRAAVPFQIAPARGHFK